MRDQPSTAESGLRCRPAISVARDLSSTAVVLARGDLGHGGRSAAMAPLLRQV